MAKQRTSGITIEPAHNVRFAVAHAERSQLSAPSYLLPPAHRLPNRVVYRADTEAQLVALHQKRMAERTRQAKRANAPAFMEGVLVLPAVKPSQVAAYLDEMAQRLADWKRAFEAATGCTVLHIAVHLDEGHMENGKPRYNTHAHALIDRTQASGQLWKPKRADLAKVQTLTAQALGMERGTTAAQRKAQGLPHPVHIPHKPYREKKEALKAEQAKAASLELEGLALKAVQATLKAEAARREIYATLRGFLKGTGQAQQKDYQALKQLNDTKHPALQALALQIEIDPPDTPTILAELRHYWPASPAPRV